MKVRFNGKYVNLCQKQNTKCSYTDFKARIKSITLSDADIEKLCGNKIPESPRQGMEVFSDMYHMDLKEKSQFESLFER